MSISVIYRISAMWMSFADLLIIMFFRLDKETKNKHEHRSRDFYYLGKSNATKSCSIYNSKCGMFIYHY